MSRHGYTDDYSNASNLWLGAVTRAIRGKRGQAFLKEMIVAFDALPEKALVRGTLQGKDGDVCAMGAVCKLRGIVPPPRIESTEFAASELGIAMALAREVAYQNDEGAWNVKTPEDRFAYMRRWVERQIVQKQEGSEA